MYSIPANEKSPRNKFLPFSTASAIQLNSLNHTEAIFVKLFTSNTKWTIQSSIFVTKLLNFKWRSLPSYVINMILNLILKTTLKNLNSKKWLTISDTNTILKCKHMLLKNPPAVQLRNNLNKPSYKRNDTILIEVQQIRTKECVSFIMRDIKLWMINLLLWLWMILLKYLKEWNTLWSMIDLRP